MHQFQDAPKQEVDISIVASATRFWLSAQIMIACILLGMVALSIQSARESVTNFPVTLNSSCSDAVNTIQESIAEALVILIDDVQNETNAQYQKLELIARNVILQSMNLTIEVFLLSIKQVNPLVYCTADASLDLTNSIRMQLLAQPKVNIDCNTNNLCSNSVVVSIINELNSIINAVIGVVQEWPITPNGLTQLLDTELTKDGFAQYINQLANFSSPTNILNLNSTQIVADAMANASVFIDVIQTCSQVSVSLVTATQRTADIMYYVEVVVWLVIVLIVVGIFLVSIVRQFPTLITKWVGNKYDLLCKAAANRVQELEGRSQTSMVTYYFLWMMKYINFRMALLTTCYGALGIIFMYSLSTFTDHTQVIVDGWVEDGLGPAMVQIQNQLQDGINQVLVNAEAQLNDNLHIFTQNQVSSMDSVLNDIISVKQEFQNYTDEVIDQMNGVPVVGAPLASAVLCMLPTSIFGIINTASNIFLQFLSDILNYQVHIPRYTFPYMAGTATKASHSAVNVVVSAMQSEIRKYQIVFIFLCIAVGILVFQGLVFLSFKKIIEKYETSRRRA